MPQEYVRPSEKKVYMDVCFYICKHEDFQNWHRSSLETAGIEPCLSDYFFL